jgi:hypothetical protein
MNTFRTTKLKSLNERFQRLDSLISRLEGQHDLETRVEEQMRLEPKITEKVRERDAVEEQIRQLEAEIANAGTPTPHSISTSPSTPPALEQTTGPSLFYCYAREDRALRDELAKHLKILERQGILSSWHDGDLLPGTNRNEIVNRWLLQADILLLLVSANFMTSDSIWGKELKIALRRGKQGEARVIPIILSPCDWRNTEFSHLQALPQNGRPITSWPDRDEAFAEIARSLRKIATA